MKLKVNKYKIILFKWIKDYLIKILYQSILLTYMPLS